MTPFIRSNPRAAETASSPHAAPTLAAISPEWVRASKLLLDLVEREEALLVDLRDMREPIAKSGLSNWPEVNRRPTAAPPPVAISRGAAEILGEFTPAPSQPEPIGAAVPELVRRQQSVAAELATVREAAAALRPKLDRLHAEGSRRLCEALMPEYKKITARICAALIELGSADLEQRTFMLLHRSAERAFLRPISATGSLGDASDSQSELRLLLSYAAEVGHFDLTSLPPEWRKRPR